MAMENGGNAKVNAIFEAKLPDAALKPTTSASGSVRERFIRDKYERRKYFDVNVLANYQNTRPTNQQSSLNASTTATRTTKAIRNPSEAARLRAQARKHATVNNTSGRPNPTTGATSTVQSMTTSTAAEVDLLDFNAPFHSDPGSPLKPPSDSSPSPSLDMFQNLNMGINQNTSESSFTKTKTTQFSHQVLQNAKAPETTTKKMTSDDIMKMFHTPGLPNQSLPSTTQKKEHTDPFANFANFNTFSGQNSSFPMQQTMNPRNHAMSAQQHIGTTTTTATAASYTMSMTMNQNTKMSYGNMNNNMIYNSNQAGGMMTMTMSGNNNTTTNGTSNMNFFQNNNGTYAADMQQQPMGGNPLNYQSMGRSGIMNSIGSSTTSSLNSNSGNFAAWNGRQTDHQQGKADAFGDVMGGSSMHTQNQFASFGSFR